MIFFLLSTSNGNSSLYVSIKTIYVELIKFYNSFLGITAFVIIGFGCRTPTSAIIKKYNCVGKVNESNVP